MQRLPRSATTLLTLLAAVAVGACSKAPQDSGAPSKPAVAAVDATVPSPVPASAKTDGGQVAAWKKGLYYINLQDSSKSCDARQASKPKPDETWVCITREQYKAACEFASGFTDEVIERRASRATPAVAAVFMHGEFPTKVGWGWPGGAREDGCFAEISMDVMEMGRMEHFEFRYRIDSFQVSDKPGQLLISDLS